MNKTCLVFLIILSSLLCLFTVQAADKFIHANSSWSTSTWYDAPVGGNSVSAPSDTDNVFTNGYILTVDGDYNCNDLTLTNIAGAITVAASNTLSIHGTLTGPGWTGNDLVGGTGTIVFKKTSGTILSNWASSTTFENIIFDPGAGNTVNFTTTGMAWCWISSTGKATIASGTLILGGAGHNVAIGSKPKETGTIEISAGATLEITGMAAIGSPDGGNSDAFRMGKLKVYGTLKYSSNNNMNVTNLYIGATGYFENTKSKFYDIAPDYYTCEGTTNNFAKKKYIHANSNWSTATWYDAPTGGNVTSAPNVADSVFTNEYKLTIDGNYHCGDITITSNTTVAITVNDSASLFIHGMLTGPGWVGNDLIDGNGSIIFRKTSGTILTNWASSSTFENIIFDPGAGNTVNFTNSGSAWCWVSATGKATIATGTLVLGGAGHNVAIGSKPKETGTIEILEGATLQIIGMAVIGSPDGGNSDAFRMGKLNVYGTLYNSSNNKINTTNLYIGSTGTFNNTKPNFFDIAPDLFISDGTTIGVDEYYIDRFIQNKVFTIEETTKGNKIWAGSNVSELYDEGAVIIDNGSKVTLDGTKFIILDKGFKTTQGGTLIVK